MFSPIKQVFIVLLSFSSSLATKCVSLNDPPFMVGPTLIDFNLTELKFYPSMISLDNVAEVVIFYLQKYVFRKKQKT